MLNDRSITTVYKVIGGLSADNFELDLVVIQTVGASFQLLSGGQFNADFGKKLSRTDNHLTRLVTYDRHFKT
jgi:CO dehydrogenase/acetyl-CoA synthase gamma subunit (corrinoid Fe-S protein)